MTADAPTSETAPDRVMGRRRISLWACVPLGLAATVVGLLPQLVAGLRLPAQDLWATQAAPDVMPVAFLPLSQYSLTLIFGLIVVGATTGGIVARALAHRLPRGGFSLIALGLLTSQAAAIAQSTIVVRDGLQERSASTLYLGALVAVCVVSFLIGIVALLLVARAPRAGALLGLTVGAVAAGPWAGGLLHALVASSPEVLSAFVGLSQWLTPVLVGVAIAWAGLDTVGRVLAALVSLALLWTAPAAMTAITSAAGSRVLARDPLAMIDDGVTGFQMALFTPEIALPPIAVAIGVAIVGLIVRWALTRAHRPASTRTEGDSSRRGSD